AAVQQFGAVEFRVGHHASDISQAVVDLLLNRCQIRCGVGAVDSLPGQFADALQVVVDFVQVAFGGLRQRDAVVGVAGRLGHAADLGGHAVGDGLAGGVVLGAVDAQARGQALDRGSQSGLRLVQIVLG